MCVCMFVCLFILSCNNGFGKVWINLLRTPKVKCWARKPHTAIEIDIDIEVEVDIEVEFTVKSLPPFFQVILCEILRKVKDFASLWCSTLCNFLLLTASFFFFIWLISFVAHCGRLINDKSAKSLPLPRPVNLACWHFCAFFWLWLWSKTKGFRNVSFTYFYFYVCWLLIFPLGFRRLHEWKPKSKAKAQIVYIPWLNSHGDFFQLTSGSWPRIEATIETTVAKREPHLCPPFGSSA